MILWTKCKPSLQGWMTLWPQCKPFLHGWTILWLKRRKRKPSLQGWMIMWPKCKPLLHCWMILWPKRTPFLHGRMISWPNFRDQWFRDQTLPSWLHRTSNIVAFNLTRPRFESSTQMHYQRSQLWAYISQRFPSKPCVKSPTDSVANSEQKLLKILKEILIKNPTDSVVNLDEKYTKDFIENRG